MVSIGGGLFCPQSDLFYWRIRIIKHFSQRQPIHYSSKRLLVCDCKPMTLRRHNQHVCCRAVLSISTVHDVMTDEDVCYDCVSQRRALHVVIKRQFLTFIFAVFKYQSNSRDTTTFAFRKHTDTI